MAAYRHDDRGDAAVIRLEGLRKGYGPVVAVEDVSFEVPNGVVTGLLGPNGAGKTTVLRTITGLVSPHRGRVLVDDLDAGREGPRARARLGVLPEGAGVYDRLTVREHLAYSGELQGMKRPILEPHVTRLLDRFGLTSLGARRAGTLSTGERRRLLLAAAMVHDPGNLVLDEPTNGLDVFSARALRREVRRLAAAGCAVLFSSHVMPEVAATCDRVVVLDKGRVVAVGTPAELMARAGTASLEEAFVSIIGSEEGLS
jgi:sodium transport system ATP-binding protein